MGRGAGAGHQLLVDQLTDGKSSHMVPPMPDVQSIPDIAPSPDYTLEPRVHATTPMQLKALADPTRRSIIDLVLDRAATTTELATALGRPKSTIDHHLKVLANAGLVRVVRTRKVRAMTESYWGRTARTIMFDTAIDGGSPTAMFLREAMEEIGEVESDGSGTVDVAAGEGEGVAGPEVVGYSTLRHARIPNDRMKEFIDRLDALALEFSGAERGGDKVFALLIAAFATNRPVLP